MDIELCQGEAAYYRVTVGGAVAVLGGRTLGHRDRLAQALCDQIGVSEMVSDLRKAALDVAERAQRLADTVLPGLPAILVAKALVAVDAQRAELARLLDSITAAGEARRGQSDLADK